LALPDISANRKRIRRHQSSTAAVLVGLYPMMRGAQER
jgi:hypothetical protein